MGPFTWECLQSQCRWCVFAQHKAVGIGVIVRDDRGRIEAAISKRIDASLGAVEAKAMSYEIGLIFAKDIGIQEFVIEGD